MTKAAIIFWAPVLGVTALLSACLGNLDVAENAQITCGSSNECPPDWTCDFGQSRCVPTGLGLNPAPRAEMGAIERSADDVVVPLMVFDPQGQTVTLTLAFDDGSGTFIPASIAPQSVQATAAGTAVNLVWPAASDFGSTTYRAAVRVRVLLRDEGGASAQQDSMPFAFGNDAPAELLIVAPGAGAVVQQNFPVRLSVKDSAADPLWVKRFEISFDNTFTDITPLAATAEEARLAATAGGHFPVDGVTWIPATAEGSEHAFVWDSLVFGRFNANNVRIAITLTDGFDETRAVSQPFSLHNQTPPTVTRLRIPEAELRIASGPIAILYSLADVESDTASVSLEYSTTAGAAWLPCAEYKLATSEGTHTLATSPQGVEHIFWWDARGAFWKGATPTMVRLTPADNFAGEGNGVVTAAGHDLGIEPDGNGHWPWTTSYAPIEYVGDASRLGAGDVDGDGNSDIVTVMDSGMALHQARPGATAGALTFTRTAPFSPNLNSAVEVLVVDLNLDGNDDVVVLRLSEGYEVTTYLSVGSGNFAPGQVQVLVGTARSPAVGDFDGDGAPDIAVPTNQGVTLLIGNVDNAGTPLGTFESSRLWTTQNFVAALAAPVVPAPGTTLVLAAANNDILFYQWQNDAFALTQMQSGVSSVQRLIAADVNLDAALDVVVVDNDGELEGATVLFNNGSGGILYVERYLSGGNIGRVGVVDLTSDFYPDLVAGVFFGQHDVWMRQNVVGGDGGKAWAEGYGIYDVDPAQLFDFTAGDINHDGRADFMLMFDEGLHVALSVDPPTITPGLLSPEERQQSPTIYGEDYATADLNRDGVEEVVVLGWLGELLVWKPLTTRGISFGTLDELAVIGKAPTCAASPNCELRLADFTGDGLVDAWVNASPNPWILPGQSDDGVTVKSFGPAQVGPTAPPFNQRILVAFPGTGGGDTRGMDTIDWSADGRLDQTLCAAGCFGSTARIRRVDAAGAAEYFDIALPDMAEGLVFATDLNSDGIPDLFGHGGTTAGMNYIRRYGQALSFHHDADYAVAISINRLARNYPSVAALGDVGDAAAVSLHIAQILPGTGLFNFDRLIADTQHVVIVERATAPWLLLGDIRLTSDGADSRLRIEPRLGPVVNGQPTGLSLDAESTQRGVIVDLPRTNVSTANLAVFIIETQFVTAEGAPYDSLYQLNAGGRVLPQVLDPRSQTLRPVFDRKVVVTQVPLDDDGDLNTGNGPRYILATNSAGSTRVRVATDTFGVVMAVRLQP